MPRSRVRDSNTLLWIVAAVSALPVLMNLLGVDFGSDVADVDFHDLRLAPELERRRILLQLLHGVFVETLLEWTASCIAAITVPLALVHFFLRRDVTTPIVATALLFSGLLDAFRILAVAQLVGQLDYSPNFRLFTWAISRTFNAAILILGTLPFLWNTGRPRSEEHHGLRYVVLVAILYGLAAYAIIYVCSRASELPVAVWDSPAIVRRPWELISLVLYMLAGGIILPRFHKMHPSLFSRALWISVLPHVIAQFYATFLSTSMTDNGAHVASFLKVVAYLVPLVGLMLDYRRTSIADSELRVTEKQLDIARQIQNSLLPSRPPDFPGYDLAGMSLAAKAVGGDYFDYIRMCDGSLGVVVADVSGHDLGASLLMADARAYLRAISSNETDVGAVLGRVNQSLTSDTHLRRFITAVLVRLRPNDPHIEYATVGHSAYVVHSDGTVTTLSQGTLPLGVLEEPRVPTDTYEMKDGDTLILMTDGIAEAAADSGEQYGLGRLTKKAAANRQLSAQATLDAIIAGINAYRKEGPPGDDMTLVVVKRRPSES